MAKLFLNRRVMDSSLKCPLKSNCRRFSLASFLFNIEVLNETTVLTGYFYGMQYIPSQVKVLILMKSVNL